MWIARNVLNLLSNRATCLAGIGRSAARVLKFKCWWVIVTEECKLIKLMVTPLIPLKSVGYTYWIKRKVSSHDSIMMITHQHVHAHLCSAGPLTFITTWHWILTLLIGQIGEGCVTLSEKWGRERLLIIPQFSKSFRFGSRFCLCDRGILILLIIRYLIMWINHNTPMIIITGWLSFQLLINYNNRYLICYFIFIIVYTAWWEEEIFTVQRKNSDRQTDSYTWSSGGWGQCHYNYLSYVLRQIFTGVPLYLTKVFNSWNIFISIDKVKKIFYWMANGTFLLL